MALYRRELGRIWWMSFEFEGRRIQESTGCTNKTAAERFQAKRKTELLERRAGITRRALPPKFEEFLLTFLDWSSKQHRAKTYELHKTNCDTLLRFFSRKWLDQITPGLVEDFKVARLRERRRNADDGSTVGPATVNRALTTLKLVFNHARKCGYAVENPTDDVKFLEEEAGQMRVVSHEEEAAYLAAASQPLRDIAMVILDTGLRPDEAFRIEAGNLDFERRTIFNPFGKTPAARRSVRVTGRVWQALRERAVRARGTCIFPMSGDPSRHIGSVRKAHDAAIRRAGIREHFHLYDLRHTYATRAAEAGVDLATLAALLGHSKIQMTMRYVHPSEQHKQHAAAQVEAYNAEAATRTAVGGSGRRVVTFPTTVN